MGKNENILKTMLPFIRLNALLSCEILINLIWEWVIKKQSLIYHPCPQSHFIILLSAISSWNTGDIPEENDNRKPCNTSAGIKWLERNIISTKVMCTIMTSKRGLNVENFSNVFWFNNTCTSLLYKLHFSFNELCFDCFLPYFHYFVIFYPVYNPMHKWTTLAALKWSWRRNQRWER